MEITSFGVLTSRIMAVGVAFVTAGCGLFEGEQICTMEAIPAGVVVEVAAPLAQRADVASVEQCQGQRCRTRSVRLDDHAGGKRALAWFQKFDRVRTRVQVELRSLSGQQVYRGEITATPEMVPPLDSPRCPKGGPQIRLAVTKEGRLDSTS